MKRLIQFQINVPDGVSEKEVEDWSRFMAGDTGKLSQINPLYNEPFDPVFGTFKIEAVQ
jgi:hypothetical protein